MNVRGTRSTSTSSQPSTVDEWLRWLETLHPKTIDLGLKRVRTVLNTLSLQEPSYRVIIIGGTNGKGSCVAFLESIYREAGFHVGSFTSPHLWRFNERLRFNGAEVADDTLIELFEIINEARGEVTLSYFEYSTLAALLHFVRSGAEVALLEVGLGGHLDAVNVMDSDASLVTSVSLDHQTWLGTTREVIGHEKAGIMRHACPAIIADRDSPISLMTHANRVGALVEQIGREFDYELDGEQWCYRGRGGGLRLGLPRPAFGGEEQLSNAAGCLAVIEALKKILPVDSGALFRGLENARLGGRMERRDINAVQWIFDVAHNPAAASVLAKELSQHPVAGRTLGAVAMMGDKDCSGILAPLMPLIDEWLVTQTGEDRDALPTVLVETLGAGVLSTVCLDIEAACELARLNSEPGDRVVVFGSFYLVGPAMLALGLYSAPSQSSELTAKWTGV